MITRNHVLHIERLRKTGTIEMGKVSEVSLIIGLSVEETFTIYEHYKDAEDWANSNREMSLDEYLEEIECARKI